MKSSGCNIRNDRSQLVHIMYNNICHSYIRFINGYYLCIIGDLRDVKRSVVPKELGQNNWQGLYRSFLTLLIVCLMCYVVLLERKLLGGQGC